MSYTVCVVADTLRYPEGGGHLWVYLNWALGFKSIGCRVIWIEAVKSSIPTEKLSYYVAELKSRLAVYNLQNSLALVQSDGESLPRNKMFDCIDLQTASEQSDLLLNQGYGLKQNIIDRFKRSALLDIDPGLLQVWLSQDLVKMAKHNCYFTIGETVGKPGALFSDCGIQWQYTPPCVFLDEWSCKPDIQNHAFTTVTHWSNDLWESFSGEVYQNDKRAGFLPFIELPKYSAVPLELAVLLAADEEEDKNLLEENGWRLRNSHLVTSTPQDYHNYIQDSYGEFSCVKPSCIRLQNAWISDRTICYLASGKPAVVQHTGESQFLPDAAGLFRFYDIKSAVSALEEIERDYAKQSKLARALAEEYFDAKKVAANLLERALA